MVYKCSCGLVDECLAITCRLTASSMSSAAHRGFLDGFRVGMSNDAGESFVTQLFVGKSPLVVPLIRQDLHILCDELSNKDTEGPDGSTFEGKSASSQCE